MKFKFFTIPALASEGSEEELNRFVASHRIVAVEKMFTPDGGNSFWSICVTYLDQSPGGGQGGKKIDYREVFDEQAFSLFSKLRTLRKEMAEKEGVPAYALFTNEQLADMVRLKVKTLGQMGGLGGVGKARVEKYGAAFLEILNWSPGPETRGDEGSGHETHASEP